MNLVDFRKFLCDNHYTACPTALGYETHLVIRWKRRNHVSNRKDVLGRIQRLYGRSFNCFVITTTQDHPYAKKHASRKYWQLLIPVGITICNNAEIASEDAALLALQLRKDGEHMEFYL